MAFVLRDRVKEMVSTEGTGAITCSGQVPRGYTSFADELATGDTTLCCVRDRADNWNTFLGTWTEATKSMARTTIQDGSSGPGVAVSLTGDGTYIWITDTATLISPTISLGPAAGTPGAAPRILTLYGDQTLSGAGGQYARFGGIVRGALTQNLEGVYATVVDEDRVAMSDVNLGISINFMAATLRAGWTGGRTLQHGQLYVGNPAIPGSSAGGTVGSQAYHVAGASFAYSYAPAGGLIGDHRGHLFARNEATRVRPGSGIYWGSTVGSELTVGVTAGCMVLWKEGMKVVKWSDDRTPGLIVDFAYGINDQTGASAWRVGWQIGGPEGVYPFNTGSQVMSYFPGLSGTPVAATGINFSGITFGRSTFESAGFRVGGTGNVGALVVSGGAVQTRGAVLAKTAVVNTITVLEGGLFTGAVTLACSASPGGGTLATATVATYACTFFAQVGAVGSGYALGDTITLTGGAFTTACVGAVDRIDGSGGVQGVAITTDGSYSVPPVGASATTTSGAGTGCTLVPFVRVLTVTVTGAGTLYDEFLPPTITSTGAVSTPRQALLQVTMTGAQVPLLLNAGSSTQVDSLTVNASGPQLLSGAGTPEGAVTAPVGSIFMRNNGGAATSVYIKESGAGNTGWVAK